MATFPLQNWQKHWSQLAARERKGVLLALVLVVLALVWFTLMAPALKTLKQAPQERARLDSQVQAMQALQRRAEALKAQPSILPQESLRALQASVTALGSTAKLQVLGDQVTVVLQQTAAPALAQWLATTPTQAGLAPQQLHLQRSPDATAWSGNVVFQLPRSAP